MSVQISGRNFLLPNTLNGTLLYRSVRRPNGLGKELQFLNGDFFRVQPPDSSGAVSLSSMR